MTGPGIFGEPADREACVRTVRNAYDGGVRVFDTAWYYGPDVASRIVREALAPYPDDLVFVSKLGGARRANGDWYAAPTRDELRAGADRECDLLGVDHPPRGAPAVDGDRRQRLLRGDAEQSARAA